MFANGRGTGGGCSRTCISRLLSSDGLIHTYSHAIQKELYDYYPPKENMCINEGPNSRPANSPAFNGLQSEEK